MDIVMIILWILILITLVFEIPHTRKRIQSLKNGVRALIFLPVMWLIAVPSIIFAALVSEIFPILKWGWLGYNAVLIPVSEKVAEKSADPTIVFGITDIALFIVIFAIIIYACLLCNYYEEESFRNSILGVIVWALLHILMGIPIFMVIPIFCMGLMYKYIYDKYSLDHSYCLHFATNCSAIGIIVVLLMYV